MFDFTFNEQVTICFTALFLFNSTAFTCFDSQVICIHEYVFDALGLDCLVGLRLLHNQT